jgi:hypothetical protein
MPRPIGAFAPGQDWVEPLPFYWMPHLNPIDAIFIDIHGFDSVKEHPSHHPIDESSHHGHGIDVRDDELHVGKGDVKGLSLAVTDGEAETEAQA